MSRVGPNPWDTDLASHETSGAGHARDGLLEQLLSVLAEPTSDGTHELWQADPSDQVTNLPAMPNDLVPPLGHALTTAGSYSRITGFLTAQWWR